MKTWAVTNLKRKEKQYKEDINNFQLVLKDNPCSIAGVFLFMEIQEIYNLIGHITDVVIDSRKVSKDSVFFALKGENSDGNYFASSALSRGACFVVVDDSTVVQDERYLLVDDVLTCLQQLASMKRKIHFDKVLGLTGSNGKTTTKELCRHVLSTKFRVYATPGNYNNHIGLPLTIMQAPPDTDILILEMGANHQGEIDMLCRLGAPNMGIITNIGKAHLEGFGGLEGVKKGKSELYRFLAESQGVVFVNSEDDTLMNLLPENLQIIPYKTFSEFNIVSTDPELTLEYQSMRINTHLIGDYNIPNIACALAIGSFFEIHLKDSIEAIESYLPDNNRSQKIVKGTTTIIMDAYNANPTSMRAALKNFSHVDGRKIAVLGDMLELGVHSHEEHLHIINLVRDSDVSMAIWVGPNFMALAEDGFGHFFKDVEQAMSFLKKLDLSDTTLLLKGSRAIHVEKVMELF
jgi:UDP-N-acetylmuramoyl-tripeptide--D-alanyl-D-alanine ligase